MAARGFAAACDACIRLPKLCRRKAGVSVTDAESRVASQREQRHSLGTHQWDSLGLRRARGPRATVDAVMDRRVA